MTKVNHRATKDRQPLRGGCELESAAIGHWTPQVFSHRWTGASVLQGPKDKVRRRL
jgi:hypothetical protein